MCLKDRAISAGLFFSALLGMQILWADDTPIDTSRVKVIESTICMGVDKRQPIEPKDNDSPLDTTIPKLYCWTKVQNLEEPTVVTHVWYWKETKRAEVTLEVGKSWGWRTWSSKLIQRHEHGQWRVEILDANRVIVDTLYFYLN